MSTFETKNERVRCEFCEILFDTIVRVDYQHVLHTPSILHESTYCSVSTCRATIRLVLADTRPFDIVHIICRRTVFAVDQQKVSSYSQSPLPYPLKKE